MGLGYRNLIHTPGVYNYVDKKIDCDTAGFPYERGIIRLSNDGNYPPGTLRSEINIFLHIWIYGLS